MNISDFGTHKYRKYDYNFLNKVIVSFAFERPDNNTDIDERMESFSISQFGVQPPKGFFEVGTSLRRSDGHVAFLFGHQQASVEIEGDEYSSFADTVIPLAYKLKMYVSEVVGIDIIKSASIRKVNLWQFEYDKNVSEFDSDLARKIIFSDNYNDLTSNVDIKTKEVFRDQKTHRWNENDNWLEIRSGFMDLGTDEKSLSSIALFLDSEGFETLTKGIKIQEVDDVLKSINTHLYNSYMWCVNEKVQKIMEEGKEA